MGSQNCRWLSTTRTAAAYRLTVRWWIASRSSWNPFAPRLVFRKRVYIIFTRFCLSVKMQVGWVSPYQCVRASVPHSSWVKRSASQCPSPSDLLRRSVLTTSHLSSSFDLGSTKPTQDRVHPLMGRGSITSLFCSNPLHLRTQSYP